MMPIFTPSARQVRERVARMVAERPAAAHLAPVFLAATRGVIVAVVGPGCHAFALPPGKPAVLIIGDDAAASRGPDGFHRASLRRALRRATHVAVMAGAPVPTVYAAAPGIAPHPRGPVVPVAPAAADEWPMLVADARAFLDTWGATAARLGWPSWALFGLHRDVPGSWRGRELIALLHGRPVVALTATEAVIRVGDGKTLTHRRRSRDPLGPAERALLRELGV